MRASRLPGGARDLELASVGCAGGIRVHRRRAAFAEEGYRTNLGLVNADLEPLDLEVRLYLADKTTAGLLTVTLGPLESTQVNRVFRQVTNDAVEHGFVEVRTTTEGGTFLAHASVVDNRTQDPSFIGQ